MDGRLRQFGKIDLGKLLIIAPGQLTILPCLMIVAVVVNKSISMDIVGIPLLSYSILATVLLSFVFMLYLYLRRGAMSRLVLMVIVFATLWMTSTIINATDVKNCFYDCCSLVFIAMVCDYYKSRYHLLIMSFALAFSLCTYLNLLHMLAHPDLWFIDDLKTNQGYLLGGNYNGMGCRLLCAVALSVVCLKYSKWWLINTIPVTLVSLVTLVIVSSMTSLTGILLFLTFCFIPSRKLMKAGIFSLLGLVFLFQVFVCFQGKGIEQNPLAIYLVEDVLGKDITFTYRTYLWDAAAKVFADSSLYGYGYMDRDWYYSHMSTIAMGPHNYIWGVIIAGGILLLTVFSYISFMSLSKLFTTTDRTTILIYAAAAVLFLMMLMENYAHLFIFTLLILAFFAPRPSTDEKPDMAVA